MEAAFQELNKVQLKPFLMRIWGQGEVGEVTSGQVPEEQQGTTMFCQGRTRVCSVKTLQISLDTECLDTEGDDTATPNIS